MYQLASMASDYNPAKIGLSALFLVCGIAFGFLVIRALWRSGPKR